MFGWLNKKRINELDKKTQEGFSSVKKDMDSIGKWIKHLDRQDKQLFDLLYSLKQDLSSLNDEIDSLREAVELVSETDKNKQLFKKLPVLDKQTSVEDVQKSVQTAVQTGNFYSFFKNFSGNERLIILTLLNSDMKLSYEDLALLLGKERSTIRGQINAIKQKSEGLVQEISEKSGKKRVFIDEETKGRLQKYVKVKNKEKNAKKT